MQFWYNIIKKDITKLQECLDHYDKEYEEFLPYFKLSGNLAENSVRIPGLIEHCSACIDDIASVYRFIETLYDSAKAAAYKKYNESYNKGLSETAKNQYAANEKGVVDIKIKLTDIKFVQNKFESVAKGLESMNYMLSNVVKLQVAGISMAEI